MVIGGQKSESEYPFYAQVWSLLDGPLHEGRSFEFCGGALIDKQWILTAGHCIKDNQIATEVVLGQNTPQVPRGGNPHTRHICARIQHPEYSEGWMLVNNHYGAVLMALICYMIAVGLFRKVKGIIQQCLLIGFSAGFGFFLGFFLTKHVLHNTATSHDIALLKLCKPVEDVKPIEIVHGTTNVVGSDIFVMGFGSQTGTPQNDLYEGHANAVSNSKCSSQFLSYEDAGFITPGAFCVESKNVFPCKGDSGSPAMLGDALVGLSSWGSRPCEDYPSVYTFVPKYKNWIDKTILSSNYL